MLKFNGIMNKTLGFKPYEIGNKRGWIKEIPASYGYKTVIKKLPSGTSNISILITLFGKNKLCLVMEMRWNLI